MFLFWIKTLKMSDSHSDWFLNNLVAGVAGFNWNKIDQMLIIVESNISYIILSLCLNISITKNA